MWTNVSYTNKIWRLHQYLVKQQIQICLTVLHIRLFQIVKTKIQKMCLLHKDIFNIKIDDVCNSLICKDTYFLEDVYFYEKFTYYF